MRPETQRPSTPLVLQKVYNQTFPPSQQGSDNRLRNNWTKSQIVTKLRQNATPGPKNYQEIQNIPEKPLSARHFQCVTAVQGLATNKNTLLNHQDFQAGRNARKNPGFIRTFSPTKGLIGVIPPGDGHKRPLASSEDSPQPTIHQENENSHQKSSHHDRKQQPETTVLNSVINISKSDFNSTMVTPSEAGSVVNAENKFRNTDRSFLYTPPPISPAQEAILYQSLEEEILFNLKQLGMDSDSEIEEDGSEPDIPMISPENSHEIRKPFTHNTCSGASYSSSGETNARDAIFKAVIAELSKERKPLEKVSIDGWIHFSKDLRDEKQERQTNTDLRQLSVSKPSMASSSSSLGSSMDSKDSAEQSKTSEVNNCGTGNKEKPQVPSTCHRRSLKKPERVPSIYKLKLRPCVRPRRDHRPDKTPTKIPKPLCYRRSPSPEDTQDNLSLQNTVNTVYSRKSSQTISKFSATKCKAGDQEIIVHQELEFWL